MISKLQLEYFIVNHWATFMDDGKATKNPSHLDFLLAANFLASAELMSPVGLTAKLAHCEGWEGLFHLCCRSGAEGPILVNEMFWPKVKPTLHISNSLGADYCRTQGNDTLICMNT